MYCFAPKVQPSSDIPERTTCPEETIVSIQRKGPSASLEGRNGDASCDDYLSPSDSHLTTSSPPVIVSSGSGSADNDFDAGRMHHAPVIANNSGSPVRLTASPEKTNETVTAAPPTTSLRISHGTSLNPPFTIDLESVNVKDGTGQETIVAPSLVQGEKDEDPRVRSQVRYCS